MKRVALMLAGLLCLPPLGSSRASGAGDAGDALRGAGPAIDWHTIDCGGAMTLSSGTIQLSGTLGQHDAGAVLAGGSIELTGGFWAGLAQTPPLTCGCGDLDDNNIVDLGDFATFAGCFGLIAPDSNCTADVFACADLNGSGAIDLNDFSIFSGTFGLPPSGSPPDCQ